MLTFMDNETYEQISVHEDLVGEPVVLLQEGMTVTIESYAEEPISVMLPDTVVMKIVEADQVGMGQNDSSSYNPEMHDNGARIIVRPHLDSGARVVATTADANSAERTKGSTEERGGG